MFDKKIENCVCENKNLDYKKELHVDFDLDKKEFLADVSSFANASGGDIIFGVKEDNKEKYQLKLFEYHIIMMII